MVFKDGVFSPTANGARLNVNDLTNALSSGNVTVTTGNGSSGNEAGNLYVLQGFTWTTASALSLDAYHSIFVRKPLVDAGTGSMTVTDNDGSHGGVFLFGSGGSISIWNLSNSLKINNVAYTLVGDLHSLAADVASNPSGKFALANAYDASKDGTYVSSPVPTTFTGRFDALGNAISHLAISSRITTTNIGLFQEVDGGWISHAVLSAIRFRIGGAVHASLISIGALVGLSEKGKIWNASVTGKMLGSDKYNQEMAVGGLVGSNEGGNISDAQINVSIAWKVAAVGGAVGSNDGNMSKCHAYGTIVGGGSTPFLGGLAASNGGGAVIELSSASGSVTYDSDKDPGGSQNGGLVGENQGMIDQSWASGNVSGGIAGGLVGLDSDPGIITNSYSTGAVLGDSGARAVGGFMGSIQFTSNAVQDVYSTGAVSSQKKSAYLGGFVGWDVSPPELVNTYWDTDTSGITDLGQGAGSPSNDAGITGLTTQQLQSGLPMGFVSKFWAQNSSINNGFPYLIANPPLP